MQLSVYVAKAQEVYEGLDMGAAIDLMRQGFIAMQQGRIDQPLRTIVRSHLSSGFLGMMPACIDMPEIYPEPLYGAKMGTLFPDNVRLGKDPHQGCVLLMSGLTGEIRAILDASSVTALRTAAVSGLATDMLARPDASVLTLFGGGHQALWQLRAVAQVRRLSNVFVITRSAQSAQHFIEEAQAYLDCPLIAGVSAQEAVSQSDMVLTATSSATPVLQREWLRPGTHITAMGSSTPASSELDGPTMTAGRLFVDRAQSTRNESGEFLNACKQGYLSADTELNELGAVLEGQAAGRINNEEITIFKSLGLAFEDVLTAAALLSRHAAQGNGRVVEL
ncbi:ornithine cyclodeaminase family protein [Alcaligenes faecalis]|uniref:ornithine cyclodeaminase family protein n=1 Tax=Alcaligenes faecalis TaxID=511 RepID=UPI000B4DB09D|nr:ornithine cyclodeaminase family protein [Alcaligenes faecalis]ASC90580.1 ornithine cyclodeaminase [Alcaligenes faecalis]